MIDTLTEIGLIPEETAMGAPMMMSIFMKPGDDKNTLNLTIQATPDGQISANGRGLR